MSVPIAKAIGKPRMFKPGVTIQAPPIPKKPPMMPTPRPRMTSPGQKISTPAIGMVMYSQSIALLESPTSQCSATDRDFRLMPIRAIRKSASNPRIMPTTGIVSTVTAAK